MIHEEKETQNFTTACHQNSLLYIQIPFYRQNRMPFSESRITFAFDKLQPLRRHGFPDSKVHGANMGPTWVLSALDGPHVGPMNLAIRVGIKAPIEPCWTWYQGSGFICMFISSFINLYNICPKEWYGIK